MSALDADLGKLQAFIAEGRFADQERLPPERDLCQALGLSRTRLRTCLGRLERQGLIWRHVGRGTFVGAPPAAVDPLAPAPTNPVDVMDARLALEPELARRAAVRASPSAIAEMRACIARMAGEDYNGFEAWDRRLHREIALAASSPLMLAMFDLIQSARAAHTHAIQRRAYGSSGRMQAAHGEHAAIIDAIADRDAPAAEAAMRAHLRDVRRALFGE